MSNVLAGLAGIILASLLLIVIRRVPPDSQRLRLAIGLAVAASIYAAFAILGGAGGWIRVEIVATVAFSLLAALAASWSVVLGIAWLLHVGWDFMHWQLLGGAIAPAWYPPLCITFDILIGVYLIAAGIVDFRDRER